MCGIKAELELPPRQMALQKIQCCVQYKLDRLTRAVSLEVWDKIKSKHYFLSGTLEYEQRQSGGCSTDPC